MSEDAPRKVVSARRPRRLLERFSEAELPTARGPFQVIIFREKRDMREHVALVRGEVAGMEGVPVRIHSECLTSEVFGSLKCDCREQLERALELVSQRERGVVLYLRQEGRGIGLGNKIKAYALQAEGLDTYEANRHLGFQEDLRKYDVAAEMLRELGVASVELITNNPLKIAGLIEEGIAVRRRIPAPAAHTEHNRDYLRAKRDHTGHLIDFEPDEGAPSDDEAVRAS